MTTPHQTFLIIFRPDNRNIYIRRRPQQRNSSSNGSVFSGSSEKSQKFLTYSRAFHVKQSPRRVSEIVIADEMLFRPRREKNTRVFFFFFCPSYPAYFCIRARFQTFFVLLFLVLIQKRTIFKWYAHTVLFVLVVELRVQSSLRSIEFPSYHRRIYRPEK